MTTDSVINDSTLRSIPPLRPAERLVREPPDKPTEAHITLFEGGVPFDLRQRRQWVVWRREERDGKATKVPYAPRARTHGGRDWKRASPTNPETWGTLAEAWAALRLGKFSGVGFVFTPGDRLVGIDLDHCRDPSTGTVASWATGIIERFDSYSEISPSGTGVHVIVACSLPLPPGNRQGDIEIYQQGRYFAITGDVLDAGRRPAVIADRTADLLAWHAELFGQADPVPFAPPKVEQLPVALADQEVIDRACAAANGPKVRRLLDGETSDYPSASEADLALCRLLAFYTQDPDQLDRLVRRSALYRRKWERADYRDAVLRTAISSLTATFDPAYRSPRPIPPRSDPASPADPDLLPAPGDVPDDPAVLRRLLAEQARVLSAEREQRRAAEAKAAMLERVHSTGSRILGNRALGQARLTALVLSRFFANLESAQGRPMTAPAHLSLQWVADRVGISDDVAGKHVTSLADAGLILKTRRTIPGYVDQETGELVPTRTEVWVMPRATSASAFAEAAAAYELPDPVAGDKRTRWGGKRERRLICADHPGAAVIRTTHDACAECGSILAETSEVIVPALGSNPDEDAARMPWEMTGEDEYSEAGDGHPAPNLSPNAGSGDHEEDAAGGGGVDPHLAGIPHVSVE